MTLQIIRTVEDLRAATSALRREGKVIGMVPTMGALHDGHLSLVRAAQEHCDAVVVSIFVNPTQFNDPADLEKYPRTEDTDIAMLKPLGVDIVYAPNAKEMYATGFATNVSVSGISDGLCGATRPGHFDGVATVVTKLLLQAMPDKAFFGEKDFQQLAVIRRFVADLNIPVVIKGCPTQRENDGLAMSSRNTRLSERERKIAPQLFQTLKRVAAEIESGADVKVSIQEAGASLIETGFAKVDYLELRASDDLTPLDQIDRPARLFVAAFLGDVRLIDNVEVSVR